MKKIITLRKGLLLSKTISKPTPVVVIFALAAAAVILSVGYIMTLTILAPQQLAEATTAAADLACSGCVGTTDIANSAVTTTKIGSGQVATSDLATDSVISSKIGSGQVGNSDIANNAVGSAKIGSGQVGNTDLATSAVTTSKISDTNGVASVDIVDGQVTSADIADGTITSTDIAPGTIPSDGGFSLQVTERSNTITSTDQGGIITVSVQCNSDEVVTGGGFSSQVAGGGSSTVDHLIESKKQDNGWSATWRVPYAFDLTVYAECLKVVEEGSTG